jgi:oligoendopeptidase F
LQSTAGRVFWQVDARLGDYFQTMRSEGLLDLENHKGKAPGAYCTAFPATQRPFIFMNAVGLPTDVRTILHESGHAFHVFEAQRLPYAGQRHPGAEFAEVASMGMELLASPYLSSGQGGFYAQPEADRFMIEQLERILIFWPYMAVVDAFQHWVYQNHAEAAQAENCDAKWLELWRRFIPGVDWGGLEAEAMTGWHRKLHIFRYPFYYVEYGVAQMGAVQIWGRALQDQKEAVTHYLKALSLGATARLPELYQTAGARFAFDAGTLEDVVALVETNLERLEGQFE